MVIIVPVKWVVIGLQKLLTKETCAWLTSFERITKMKQTYFANVQLKEVMD